MCRHSVAGYKRDIWHSAGDIGTCLYFMGFSPPPSALEILLSKEADSDACSVPTNWTFLMALVRTLIFNFDSSLQVF